MDTPFSLGASLFVVLAFVVLVMAVALELLIDGVVVFAGLLLVSSVGVCFWTGVLFCYVLA